VSHKNVTFYFWLYSVKASVIPWAIDVNCWHHAYYCSLMSSVWTNDDAIFPGTLRLIFYTIYELLLNFTFSEKKLFASFHFLNKRRHVTYQMKVVGVSLDHEYHFFICICHPCCDYVHFSNLQTGRSVEFGGFGQMMQSSLLCKS